MRTHQRSSPSHEQSTSDELPASITCTGSERARDYVACGIDHVWTNERVSVRWSRLMCERRANRKQPPPLQIVVNSRSAKNVRRRIDALMHDDAGMCARMCEHAWSDEG